jgi:RNA polymerase sigma-70 factor, ECF subfamily
VFQKGGWPSAIGSAARQNNRSSAIRDSHHSIRKGPAPFLKHCLAHFEALKYRDSKRRIRVLGDAALEQLADAAMPISAEIGERRLALAECLKKLPSTDHDLIRQRYYDGLSVSEIAGLLNRSTYAIYRELGRVHGALSRCIQRSTIEEGV